MSEIRDEKRYIGHLTDLMDERDYSALMNELRDDNEVDIALFMETLPDDKTAFVFRMLPKEFCAEVFAHLESDTQRRVVEAFTDEETTQMLDQLLLTTRWTFWRRCRPIWSATSSA